MASLLLLAILLAVPGGKAWCRPGESLVPSDRRISDAQAQNELVFLLASNDSSRAEAPALIRSILSQNPQNAEARLFLAELVALEGRVEEGRDEYVEELLAALPVSIRDNGVTQECIGNAYFLAGRMLQAAKYYRQSLDNGRPVLSRLAQSLAWGGKEQQALLLLERLHAQQPDDRKATLLLARLRLEDGDSTGTQELVSELESGLDVARSEERALLADVADLEGELGHAGMARALYDRIVTTENDEFFARRRARAMYLWGAFDSASAFWMPRSKEDPEACLELGRTFVAAQRRAEAEGAFRRVILHPGDAPQGPKLLRQARLDLARLKLEQHTPEATLDVLGPLLAEVTPSVAVSGELREAVLLAASARWQQKRPAEGLHLLDYLGPNAAPVLRAQLLQALGEDDAAKNLLLAAHAATPDDPEIAFLVLGDAVDAPSHLDSLTAPGATSPSCLTAWARLYTAQRRHQAALRCLNAALAADQRYFPARMAKAEALASARRYDECLSDLEGLEREFPDSSQIRLTRARVLSWAKQYPEAQKVYTAMSAASPSNPIPIREAARVYSWAKEEEQAQVTYARLLAPPVDAMLTEAPWDATTQVQHRVSQERIEIPYLEYEALLQQDTSGFSTGDKAALQDLLTELLPTYWIQKGVWLESQAEQLAFDRRFLRALPVYDELLEFEPDNQEARFDQAQAACSLGVASLARSVYERLLEIDPMHMLAGPALEQMDRRAAPQLTVRHNVWHESGRGRLARILRQRSDLGLTVTFADDYHMTLTQHLWEERPRSAPVSEALGQTLAFYGVFTPSLRGECSWTQKRYSTDGLGTLDTGRAWLEYNFNDWALVGGGWERREELANKYALRQHAASNNLFMDLRVPVNRRWDVAAEVWSKSYDDSNQGDLERVAVGYLVSDHPRQLKVTLSGERRDTVHQSQEQYLDGKIIDIVHPYWTPQDYLAGALELEWRHDLAEEQYCGAPQHWYALRPATGTDSDDNLFSRLEAEWFYEFSRHWSVDAKWLIHRSQQWDADGLWLGLGYRF